MLSDLASEVLKVTETQSAHFALEKTVMEKSCLLRVEWPIQRFSIRIHNNKPIVVESLFEVASIFCIALCNTGLQSTFVKVVHKQSLRTWASVGLVYRSSYSLLDFESVCNWIKRYVLRKHHLPPSLGPRSDEDTLLITTHVTEYPSHTFSHRTPFTWHAQIALFYTPCISVSYSTSPFRTCTFCPLHRTTRLCKTI